MSIAGVLRRNSRIACCTAGWRELFARVAALALPGLCVLCGNACNRSCNNMCGNSPRNIVCSACDEAYWNEARLRCAQCALPLSAWRARHAHSTGYRCGACRRAPPPFDATFALADYRPPLASLVLDLKFGARLALGGLFAERLARAVRERPAAGAERPDLIAPVPLARRRLVERGYNQAWAIARPLARALEVRAEPALLVRTVHTAPQTRLDAAARRENVAHAFAVTGDVCGLHVGLVDDVMTSGATLAALAVLLKRAGARRVTNYVALRTSRD
ncbi:ComF family protein [Burkholderia glumae]|uniref:ComF family protein n=1 Tax=Burkholderia glumae TaxID=337 RepID=UPI000C275459|nr:ComF family protein [Burkholderia glumae]PJO24508.1 amidophosphoribosyltransferase [Burkholderia glumae AU6208]QHE10847.1 ComF family protein [Burkholderia glumae AU6208]